jgi:predicted XRE-type DNA-binding protein
MRLFMSFTHSKRKLKRPLSTTSKLVVGATRRSSGNVKRPLATEDDSQITLGSGNVFLDVGFPSAEAENLRIRADLLLDLRHVIREKGWTQVQAAEFFQETQPRISCLMNGDVTRFSIDKLINLLAKAGLRVHVAVKKAA